jgi:hypothetical protein
MPPIRRTLTFIIIILLIFVFTHFPSRNSFQTLFTSQDTGLHSSSYTKITGSFDSQPNVSTSTSTKVETSIPGSEVVTGFALFDRLYLRNGTFFIVTANQSAFPSRRYLIAPGLDMGAGHDMEPTDKVPCSGRVPYQTPIKSCLSKELRFIDPGDAERVLGPNAIRIGGFSVVVYDTEQFMRVRHLL